MLVTLRDILPAARAAGKAVGLFNTLDPNALRGVLQAAQETGSPVIIGTAEVLLPSCPLETIADMLLPAAQRADVPVCVHLDHGLTLECIARALELGFSSVMIDASVLPYADNLAVTSQVVGMAHAYGASVEAELGHVGMADSAEGEDSDNQYTDPAQAAEFAAQSGVDALAVSIGTLHGAYRAAPKLDFDLLARLRATTDVPLVLHGGSGLRPEDFAHARAGGIAKVNIFTDIDVAAARAVREGDLRGMSTYSPAIIQAIAAQARLKMGLFGWGN